MTLKAALTVGPNGIDVEYYDAPPAVSLGLNVPMCYTDAYTAFGIKCIVAPKVPNNWASLATIRTTAPDGSILNARHPAPVAARSTIGHMLPDVMFGCLIQALPEGVPAEGTSCLWNLRLMGGAGRVELEPGQMQAATPFNVMSFHSGGTGARPRAAAQGALLDPRQRPPDRLDAGRRRLRRSAQAAGREGRRGRGAGAGVEDGRARALWRGADGRWRGRRGGDGAAQDEGGGGVAP